MCISRRNICDSLVKKKSLIKAVIVKNIYSILMCFFEQTTQPFNLQIPFAANLKESYIFLIMMVHSARQTKRSSSIQIIGLVVTNVRMGFTRTSVSYNGIARPFDRTSACIIWRANCRWSLLLYEHKPPGRTFISSSLSSLSKTWRILPFDIRLGTK